METVTAPACCKQEDARDCYFVFGIAIAEGMGLMPHPFLMGLANGASTTFLAPIGHQALRRLRTHRRAADRGHLHRGDDRAAPGLAVRAAAGAVRPLFDWWGRDVWIKVEPLEGCNSARTNGSVSDSLSDSRAPIGAPVPISPSAQAACPRTSGSGSESDDSSTCTASGEPQFPNATATFRKNPARPERRSADPRENASQPASSSDMSSMSDGESVPGCQPSDGNLSTPGGGSPGPRAANEASEDDGENFRGYGHTSWVLEHPYVDAPAISWSLRWNMESGTWATVLSAVPHAPRLDAENLPQAGQGAETPRRHKPLGRNNFRKYAWSR
jgi:hypothetical protein